MFFSVSLKKISVVVILIILVICGFFAVSMLTKPVYSMPSVNMTIVIDAGHGGADSGTLTPDQKHKESDINLEYSKTLETFLRQSGFNVVQTRKTKSGLYGTFGRNYKDEDMQKRKEIILKANPVLVVSMHTNFFTDSSQCGAQTFYQQGDENSAKLAESVQSQFVGQLGSTRTALSGDYFICKCHNSLSIITECGFLSNEGDVEKILSEDYKNKYCYALACGIIQNLITPSVLLTEK